MGCVCNYSGWLIWVCLCPTGSYQRKLVFTKCLYLWSKFYVVEGQILILVIYSQSSVLYYKKMRSHTSIMYCNFFLNYIYIMKTTQVWKSAQNYKWTTLSKQAPHQWVIFWEQPNCLCTLWTCVASSHTGKVQPCYAVHILQVLTLTVGYTLIFTDHSRNGMWAGLASR